MNQTVRPLPQPVRIGHSACPHDCPSTCALEVEVLDDRTIGRVRGAPDNTYTSGVICAKVARYAERIHHPDRLLKPMRRVGPKGSGQYAPIGWDDALDLVAEKFLEAERRFGALCLLPERQAVLLAGRPVHLISGATGEGVPDLLRALARVMAERRTGAELTAG